MPVQAPFFGDDELAAIRADPNGIAALYTDRKADFIALLNDAMASMPEEYLKLAFTTVLSYELTPYGDGVWSNDLATLLGQPTMMCRNYCDVAWQLYNMIGAAPDADIALVGWNRGAVGNHAQLMFALPGEGALLADPTIGLFALTDGYNDLVAGSPIAPDNIATFFWREEQGLSAFNDKVEGALIDGAYRAGSTIYWYETTEYLARYGGSAWNPGPQREALVFSGETNNLTSSTLPNQTVAEATDSIIVGGVGSDILQAHAQGSVLFGGTASLGGPSSFGIALRSDAFFSASEIASIAADPAAIAALYAARADEFAVVLGSAFAALSEDQRKLAFSALLAHEAATFNPLAPEAYTLNDLLAASELTADSYSHLAWLLFQQLVPDANPDSPTGNLDIVQIGWNGGASGRGAQLLFNTIDGPSLLVDTTLAHLALVSGFNALAAGEMVAVNGQISLLSDAGRTAMRDQLITSLHDGLIRAGDVLYWFETPDDVSFFFQSPASPPYTFYDVGLGSGPVSWSSPQGEEVLYGADANLAQGDLAIHDTLFAGAGADTLSGDSIAYNDGVWAQATAANLSWWVGDFDGDGRDDAFSYNPGFSGAYMYLSTGGQFENAGSWTGAGKGAAGWYVGDFNGDGKDDIFRYMPGSSGADMFLSNGTRFIQAGSWTGAGYGTHGWYVGDFNGDGKDDIFRYLPGSSGADMFLSDGTRFIHAGSWSPAGSGADGWYVGDFNGDGMDDIMRYMPGTSGGQMFLSTGNSFAFAGSWTGAGHGEYEWSVQDVNGDGLDDLVGNPLLLPYGSSVLVSTGASFVLTDSISPYGEGATHWRTGDFNGDGITDFIDAASIETKTYIGIGIGHEDEDRFVFAPGALNNDVILDFQGAGVDGGDELWLRNFGAPEDMSIANIADTHGAATDWWLVTNILTGESEQFRLAGVYNLGADDFIFLA